MKKLFIALIIIAIAGFGIGYYIWNKPHDSIENHQAEAVNATALAEEFGVNEVAANKKYLNQPLAIKGTPSEITQNQDGNTVLFFSEDGISGVQCTLKDKNVSVNTTDPIEVNGFCNGYTTVVLLSDCIIKK